MGIYPCQRFAIDTPLKLPEVYAALDGAVEPFRRWRWGGAGAKPFQGEFSTQDFKISRIIGYRNSFLPVIVGSITPTTAGCRIEVTMRLHRAAAIGMGLWLGFVAVIFAILVTARLSGQPVALPGLVIPAGMLLFGVALCCGSFWWEAKKARPLLLALFNVSS